LIQLFSVSQQHKNHTILQDPKKSPEEKSIGVQFLHKNTSSIFMGKGFAESLFFGVPKVFSLGCQQYLVIRMEDEGGLRLRHQALTEAEMRKKAQEAPQSPVYAHKVEEARQLDESQQKQLLSRASKLVAAVPTAKHLKDIIDMLHLQIKGQYSVEWTTKLAFLAAILYLVSPLDVLPDTIPIAGYFDDSAVLAWTIKQHQAEISRFQQWKKSHPEEFAAGKEAACPCNCLIA